MEHREDLTIQLLFSLAKDIFGTDIQDYDNILVVLQQVCNQVKYQFLKADKRLLEDVKDSKSRKRTAKCLDDGILYLNEICRKHYITLESLAITSSVDSSSFASIITSTSSQPVKAFFLHQNTTIQIGHTSIQFENTFETKLIGKFVSKSTRTLVYSVVTRA